MTLGCARCGDCCDPVHLDPEVTDAVDWWREKVADVWNGFQPSPGTDMEFVLEHLTEITPRQANGWSQHRCDFFDTDARTCTAHDRRPQMCSGYPWYGGEPGSNGASSRCAFWFDVAPADRPEGSRPLIPIEVL